MLKEKWLVVIYVSCLMGASVFVHGAKQSHAYHASVASHFSLKVTQDEQRHIHDLLHVLSHYNYWQLLWNRKEVTSVGDRVQPIPPLQFLAVIMRSAKLKEELKMIQDSSLKWYAFVEGLGGKMLKEKQAGTLNKQISGFAELLRKQEDIQLLKELVGQNDWEGFVEILLH